MRRKRRAAGTAASLSARTALQQMFLDQCQGQCVPGHVTR